MGQLINALTNIEKNDEYYTPEIAIKPILKYLDKSKIYYDPTSGISKNIVNFLNKNGFNSISSDGRNFFKDDLPEFDIIITNPPYSMKDKFIKRCYDLNKPFALLMPISTLQGNKRSQWFMNNGLELLVLNQRINFHTTKKQPFFGVGWFCWNILPEKLMFVNVR